MVGSNGKGGNGESKDPFNVGQVTTRIVDRDGRVWMGPTFPMATEARYAYHSKMGGIVPVEVAVDTIFSNPFHYGAGGFEGIRLMKTPYGHAFIELEHNVARLVYSSLAFNLALVTETLAHLNDPNVDSVEHLQRTPREFFCDSAQATSSGQDITMGVAVNYKDGSRHEFRVPFEFRVKFGDEDRKMSMGEMTAAICSLTLLNGLAPPQSVLGLNSNLDIILGGYIRPFFWVSGEDGLKIPTIIPKDGRLVEKPMFFGIGTLPWRRYLSDVGYIDGLDTIIGPYPRIDHAMPVSQKISGNYVNSARNVNIATLLGYGEVLALNHNDEIVEGSAENLVFLFTNRRTGQLRAFCPPLSSNILAGTNRDRVLRILENGLTIGGKRVELVLEAPSKTTVLNALDGKGGWDLSALVLLGTGVGIIHARSLTYNPELARWVGCDDLRSEDSRPDPLVLRRLAESNRKFLINCGVRHPFVEELQMAFTKFVLDNEGARLTPAYKMDYEVAAERVFGVDLKEAGGEFGRKARDGYFDQRINGLTQPDELAARYREAMAGVANMARRSMDERSMPLHTYTSPPRGAGRRGTVRPNI